MPPTDPGRIRTSDDLEVSGYLEVARERSGDRAATSVPTREPRESIVIIDFGGQTAMLIARRVRELNVYCELLPHTADWERVHALNPKGFILSGGPASVRDADAPMAPAYIYESGLPVLGICLGAQLIARALGARVAPHAVKEIGWYWLRANTCSMRLKMTCAYKDYLIRRTTKWLLGKNF